MSVLKIVGVVLFALFYVCSPIDVIPDVIPILGWLDDIGVVSWACSTVGKAMPERVVAE